MCLDERNNVVLTLPTSLSQSNKKRKKRTTQYPTGIPIVHVAVHVAVRDLGHG